MEDRLETCKNCAWWWPNTDDVRSEAHRESDLMHCWECTNDLLDQTYGSDNDLSGVECYERIETGPDFGCIHWQVKEPF